MPRVALFIPAVFLAACTFQDLPRSAPDDASGDGGAASAGGLVGDPVCVAADAATTADVAACLRPFCGAGDATYTVSKGAFFHPDGFIVLSVKLDEATKVSMEIHIDPSVPCPEAPPPGPLHVVDALGEMKWLGVPDVYGHLKLKDGALRYDGERVTGTIRALVSELDGIADAQNADGCWVDSDSSGCDCTYESFEPFVVTFDVDAKVEDHCN